ncbi:hypothetical protein N8G13_00515 [Mycoplasma zalophi]|uniref:hypothetical protein n=1 Tax=Mycoplasma zalophi TaxID=191287 RepID=UPI0021C871D4|nr:hypothetical protein [Mycoplasma zalophi]MCU4116949.1 hypothetical protein [Mycoplasma zalophi]
MDQWEIWLNYYQKDKKSITTIKKELANPNSNFFNEITIKDSEIIGPCGLGEWKINELVSAKWAYAFCDVLNSLQDLSKLKILITHDGSDQNLASCVQSFANVLGSQKIKTYLQLNNQPITKDFALFTLKQTKSFTVLIHFGLYSQNKQTKSISFYQGDGLKIPNRFFDDVKIRFETFKKTNIKHLDSQSTYLNTELLLQEYVKNILKLRLRSNDKKMLKIGIIPTNSNKSILTKVLGQLDFSYKFIEKEFIIKNDSLFTFKYVKELQNFYIVDFSENNEKLTIYKHKILNQFKKIEEDDVIGLILDYIGLHKNKENDDTFIKQIILSDFISDKLKIYSEKYFENSLKIDQLINDGDFKSTLKYIYINEDAKLFSNIEHMTKFNPIMLFLILSELLNYQLTQNNGLNSKLDSLKKFSENHKVTNFDFAIEQDFVKNIIEWLSGVGEIANLNIINKKLLTHLNNNKELFLFQFFFPNKQWLTIKLDKKESKLMFYFYFTNNSIKPKEIKKFFIDNLNILNK